MGQGAEEELDLTFPLENLASYDDEGKVQKSAWVLEEGEYELYLGRNVRDLQKIPFDFTLREAMVLEQLSEKCVPHQLSKRLRPDGSYEELETSEYPERILGLDPIPDLGNEYPSPSCPAIPSHHVYGPKAQQEEKITLSDVAVGKKTLDEFMETLTDEELISLTGGQVNTGVANTFGWGNLPAHGVPNVMTADGGAGFRVTPETGVKATAWPCATMLAATWDKNLTEEVGIALGLEVKENNCGVWLGPAINIHRSPLCGRNFEYYSEDPLIAGTLASAVVHGVQSQGIGVSVKHFCVNNKETNRKNSASRVSERALREIYLRAFERIVKKEAPMSLMSSYNLLNGTHTSENRDLLTGILREEWGFTGAVTTDWWTTGEHYKELLAGNDIKMAAGYPERVKEAENRGLITRSDIARNARRVLELILRLA